MRPDQFKKKHQAPKADDRARRQIAIEAARRMLPALRPGPDEVPGRLREASEADYYSAKRKAAAVLGRPVRPGDLPSDSEVREQAILLLGSDDEDEAEPDDQPEPPEGMTTPRLADHLDRFAVYRLRLAPLEVLKQDPRTHPEGDALYHSLQVFELARTARPYDEEFLLAALLHDIGKAIDPKDPRLAAVESLRGAVTDRTLGLIADDGESGSDPDHVDDLALLHELDQAGRIPGAEVGTVESALDYLRGLEREDYLDA